MIKYFILSLFISGCALEQHAEMCPLPQRLTPNGLTRIELECVNPNKYKLESAEYYKCILARIRKEIGG